MRSRSRRQYNPLDRALLDLMNTIAIGEMSRTDEGREKLRAARQKAIDDGNIILMRKAERARDQAIGAMMEIRLGKNITFKGRIVACEVLAPREREQSLIARFRVTIEGATGRRESGIVTRLPRR